jgi:hypothetical protein
MSVITNLGWLVALAGLVMVVAAAISLVAKGCFALAMKR